MKDKPIELIVGNTQGPWEQDACVVLQQQCKKAGINLKLNVLPQSAYWESWDKWDFSLTFLDASPGCGYVAQTCLSLGCQRNEAHFKSASYDAALDAAAGSPDAKTASKQMKVCETELQDAGAMVQPFWINLNTAGSAKVKNFPQHQQEYYPFHRVWLEG